ncbi:hypothetical protein CJJ09_001942 [Candidozyma auris]|nr:hypothetical protein CJJ09_001942 [[Candida] auris]
MPPSQTEVVTDTTSKEYKMGTRGSHNIAKGLPHPYPVPTFARKEDERKWAKQHMAAAFRVFARKGFTEGTAGHISLRDPVDPTTFWLNPLAKHFALIKASDLVHVDEEGNVLPDGPQSAVNAAGFAIHAAVHKYRPDVNAACHTHSVYGKTYSALGRPLDMINQDVCMFYKSHGVYTDFGVLLLRSKKVKISPMPWVTVRESFCRTMDFSSLARQWMRPLTCFVSWRSCQCQLMAEAALRPGEKLKVIGDKVAAYTEHMTADPETLYTEFQPDFEMELKYDGDFMS